MALIEQAKAQKEIDELRAQLEDRCIVIDLLQEENAEKDKLIRSLKGQLALLKVDRRYVA